MLTGSNLLQCLITVFAMLSACWIPELLSPIHPKYGLEPSQQRSPISGIVMALLVKQLVTTAECWYIRFTCPSRFKNSAAWLINSWLTNYEQTNPKRDKRIAHGDMTSLKWISFARKIDQQQFSIRQEARIVTCLLLCTWSIYCVSHRVKTPLK